MTKSTYFFILIFLCVTIKVKAQPGNDDCMNATVLCANQSVQASNAGATVDACPGCSDGASAAGNFCFGLDNTIWYSFTTNATGGDAQVDLSNLNFNTNGGFDTEIQAVIIEAGTPCDESTYTAVSNCESAISGDFTLNATGLSPNTTYYIQIDGDNTGVGVTDPAEVTMDIMVSGTAVDQTPPTVTVTTPTTDVCVNDEVTFTADTSGCNTSATIEWFVDGASVSSGTDNTFSMTGLADQSQVSATYTCNTTCPNIGASNSITMNVEDPMANAGPDFEIDPGESVVLQGSGNGTYSWGPSEGLSSTTSAEPLASPSVTTTYQLTVTSPSGCESYDEVTVVVSDPIQIPNTFTPNDDGHNDTWRIKNIENYPSAKVQVYDRWGQRLFNEVGYTEEKEWDGTHRGARLPSGTYFYNINLNTKGDSGVYTGYVMIIH